MKTFKDFELHVFNLLNQKDFLFVINPKTIHSKVFTQATQASNWAKDNVYPLFYKVLAKLYNLPDWTVKLSQKLINEQADYGDLTETEVIDFFEELQANFSLNAIKISNTWVSYVAIVNCDHLSKDELIAKLQRFEALAHNLQTIAGKKITKIAGFKSGSSDYLLFNTLCLVFSNLESYRRLESTVKEIEFKNTSILGSFWSTLMSQFTDEYKGAFYFDKVVYCLFDNKITGSAFIRSPWHFGCSLDELVMKDNLITFQRN